MLRRGFVFALMLMLLAACGGDGDDDSPDPTTPPEPQVQPTETAEPELPTRAQPDDANDQTDVSQPTATVGSGVQPLPPSWTPTEEVTLTPIPTTPAPAVDEPVNTPVEAPTARLECATFTINRQLSDQTFTIGEEPVIAWEPVEGTTFYRVTVFDSLQTELHTQLVEETSYSIPADVFRGPGSFFWNVHPAQLVNGVEQQTCPDIGEVLTGER